MHIRGFWLTCFACLACASPAPAGEPPRPETPLERAFRLAASAEAKDRAEAIELLRTLKGTGHIEKERALWLYAKTGLSLRREWPAGIEEGRTAFAELAKGASFEFMRWRGDIGAWEVRLAECQAGRESGKLDDEALRTRLAAVDDEVDRYLARQTGREFAVDMAFLLGQVREERGDLPGALKAYRFSLRLIEDRARDRKVLSAQVEDYWGTLDARQARAAADRVSRILNAKKEPQLSFDRARALQKQKKLKEARELFEKIAKEYPTEALAAASEYYAAECTYGLGDYADSQGRLQRFIEASPGGAWRGHAHLLLGDMLTLLAFDLDRGGREYRAVLKPDDYSPWWPKLTREAPRQEEPDSSWDEVKYGACERLEYEKDASGNARVKGGRLLLAFDYPPKPDANDPGSGIRANYRWSLTLGRPEGEPEEVAHGSFAGGLQLPAGLAVPETRRLYTLTAWYEKGAGPNPERLRPRSIRVRVLGIVPRGFGPVEPSKFDWSLSFQNAAPGGSWFSQEGFNRFAFRKNRIFFGDQGMDVFFRARYGSVNNGQAPAGEMAEVNSMTWEPQTIAEMQKRYYPAKPQGPGMPNRGVWMPMVPGGDKAHYVGLAHDKFPPDNGGFGLKQVDVTVGDATWHTPYWAYFDPAALLTNNTRTDCSIAADEAAEPRLAALRAVGTYNFPAWYYYWSKELGDANGGVCDFSITPDGDEQVFTTEYVRLGLPGGLPDDIEAKAAAVCQPTGKIYFSKDTQRFRNLPNRFRWPEEGDDAMPDDARYFGWRVETLPDKVNVIVAHERTHRVCFQKTPAPGARRGPGQLDDKDEDRVPDIWERSVGLDPGSGETFSASTSPHFLLYSPRGASPDNEFYAWINAAFSPNFEGTILDVNGKDIRAERRNEYYGVVPHASRRDLDWSAGGVNWDLGSGE